MVGQNVSVEIPVPLVHPADYPGADPAVSSFCGWSGSVELLTARACEDRVVGARGKGWSGLSSGFQMSDADKRDTTDQVSCKTQTNHQIDFLVVAERGVEVRIVRDGIFQIGRGGGEIAFMQMIGEAEGCQGRGSDRPTVSGIPKAFVKGAVEESVMACAWEDLGYLGVVFQESAELCVPAIRKDIDIVIAIDDMVEPGCPTFV